MGRASRRILASESSFVLGVGVGRKLMRVCRYTYSVCFFGEAVQKSNDNNARTSLGYVVVLREERRKLTSSCAVTSGDGLRPLAKARTSTT